MVLENKATLTEIRNEWTLQDLMECHEALDYQQWMEEQQMNKAKK